MDVTNPLQVPPPQERNKIDLQKMLIDERIRCDTHKTNYQVLKEQHKLLQEENVSLNQQLAKFKSSGVESSEGLQTIINDLRSQLANKEREVETVRAKTLNPQRLEVIKAEITKELEAPMKEHVDAMDREVEKYRGEYNKLRYEHTFMKSEYEHLKSDHKRILEELMLRHQAQMATLKQERDEAVKACEQRPIPTDVDAHKIQSLQRQKTQLEMRVKHLLDEITEKQKEKEYATTEADKIQRTQAKEIAQLHGNLKGVESEKRSLDVKCERLQKEVQSNSEHNTRLTQQLQDRSREISSLKSLSDQESHKHKVEMSNYKLKEMKIQGDLEREKDSLLNRVRSLETEIEVIRHEADEHTAQIDELERDAARRIQEARQEEWTKNHQLQTEKIDLEEKCSELERKLNEERTSWSNEREQNEERVRTVESSEAALQSEVAALRSKVDGLSKVGSALDKEREDCVKIRQKLHDKEIELQTSISAKQQTLSELQRVREDLKNSHKVAEEAKIQAERVQVQSERNMEENRLAGMEEKHRLKSRIDLVENKLAKSTERNEKTTSKYRKSQQLMMNKIKSLRNKCELLAAEKEQLEIEMKAGRHGVSQEEYNRLRKRFNDLRRKNNEFARTLHLSGHDINTSTHPPFDTVLIPLTSTLNNRSEKDLYDDDYHEKDLSLIHQRLNIIEEQQKIQDEALDNASKPDRMKKQSPRFDEITTPKIH